jgi:protease-4
MANQDWQQDALNNLLVESLREQRRRRRWGIFFKFILVAFVLLFLFIVMRDNDQNSTALTKTHTALIKIDGPIMANSQASADNIVTSLRDAFKSKGTKGIVLRINSPGGSPVQSHYIYNEIMRLRAKHPKIKVYAVCSDICASGAYFIAAAANDIYADQGSLVGSIGVIMNGFGFVDTMKKVGATRRVYTAGDHKAFLDPFSPVKPSELKFVHTMLDTLHTEFINDVKKGRGNRLKINNETFSGLIWTGVQAKKLGLIDGFGSAGSVSRDVVKAPKMVDYTIKTSYFERIADRVGASAGEQLSKAIGLKDDLHISG